MAVSANFRDYVLDQLRGLGSVRARRMFGGIGVYCDELFFALIDDDTLYFKVDDSNRNDYLARGCEPFRPVAKDPNAVSLSYYRVPSDVLDDIDEIRTWGRKAVNVAAASATAKRNVRPRKRAAKQAKRARSSSCKS